MYWNMASQLSNALISRLTLTWDVLKFRINFGEICAPTRLTLTWDVLKLKWMFYKTPCSTD